MFFCHGFAVAKKHFLMEGRMKTGETALERLVHFHCATCHKWWSIGDAPREKTHWFCPWCGEEQIFEIPAFTDPEKDEPPPEA